MMKRIIGFILCFVLVIGLMTEAMVQAVTDGIWYDGNGDVAGGATKLNEAYTVVENHTGDITWESGNYVVKSDVTIEGVVTLADSSNICLILCDGCSLTVSGHIYNQNGSTLNIYAGSTSNSIAGTGALKVSYRFEGGLLSNAIDIGGESFSLSVFGGMITINSFSSNGIYVQNGGVTVCGGRVETCSTGAAHSGILSKTFTINGGTVIAKSEDGFCIFALQEIRIDKGTVIVNGRGGIYTNGTVSINGGTVDSTANGDFNANSDGIFASDSINISGGTVMATGGTAADSSGIKCSQNNISIRVGLLKYQSNDGSAWTEINPVPADFKQTEKCAAIGIPVAEIGVARYPTLDISISRCRDTDTIKLIEDVTTVETTTIGTDSVSKTVTLDLDGHGITYAGEEESKASVFTVGKQGNLTLQDSVTGGFIRGGTGSSDNGKTYGGGVNNNGHFTMEGGTITGNTADYGGGVNNAGIFTMEGGTIEGNTADNGGGLYNNSNASGIENSGTVYMLGGTITGNTATLGGGVYNNFSFQLQGDSEIRGNMDRNSNPNNLYLPNNIKVTISAGLRNVAPIGVSMQTPGVFTRQGDQAFPVSEAKDNFSSDASAYIVDVVIPEESPDNPQLMLKQKPAPDPTPYYPPAHTDPPATTTYYSVVYLANAPEYSGSMKPQSGAKGTSFTLASNRFSRKDYTFNGWNTRADGTGTSYADGETLKLTWNLFLYAQWVPNLEPVDLSGMKIILEYDKKAYKGKSLKPKVMSIVNKSGEEVLDPQMCKVTYKNNIRIGTATVTVKGKSGLNYIKGSQTASFTIAVSETKLNMPTRASKSKKSITIKCKPEKGAKVTGYVFTYKIPGRSWKKKNISANRKSIGVYELPSKLYKKVAVGRKIKIKARAIVKEYLGNTYRGEYCTIKTISIAD